jgi:hypothetical protein
VLYMLSLTRVVVGRRGGSDGNSTLSGCCGCRSRSSGSGVDNSTTDSSSYGGRRSPNSSCSIRNSTGRIRWKAVILNSDIAGSSFGLCCE